MTSALRDQREGVFNEKDRWSEACKAVKIEIDPAYKEIIQNVQKRLGIEDIS